MKTKGTNLILLVVFCLLFTGLISKNGAIMAFLVPFLVYLGTGLLTNPKDPDLYVERVLSSERVSQMSTVQVQLAITNQGTSIERLSVEDILPPGVEITDGCPRLTTTLEAGETVEINYSLKAKRGVYQIPGFHLKINNHLGLFQIKEERTLPNRFLVLPDTHKLPVIPIRPRNTRVYPGIIPSRKGGPGVEFFGVREYRPGDPLRWVNDRLSARHEGVWYVNEFQQERAVDVGLILDCRMDTNRILGSTELFEYCIQATATLSESFLKYGNRVGLLAYGGIRTWVQPGYSKLQRERILQALAEVRLYDRMVDKELTNLPTRLFPARSQLVLISSLLVQDLSTLVSLRARGYPLLVISPDPIAFEAKHLKPSESLDQAVRFARLERDFLVRELRRAGAQVFEWKVEEPFHTTAHRALSHPGAWRNHQGAHYA